MQGIESVGAGALATAAVAGRDAKGACVVAATDTRDDDKGADGAREAAVWAADCAALEVVGLGFQLTAVVPSAANLAVVLAINRYTSLGRRGAYGVDFGHTHIA